MNKHVKRVAISTLVIGAGVGIGLWVFYGYYYIPHFSVVEEGVLYRCGQPDQRDLERLREDFNVRTVVNLRQEDEQEDCDKGLGFDEEAAEAKRLGMKLVNIPMNGNAPVDPNVIKQWLDIVQNKENLPVAVHCKQGVDRTGLLVAVFRTEVQGWPAEKALAEAIDERMDAEKHPHIKNYILASRASNKPTTTTKSK
ncbi:MAG: tyrosine-protein phosphatase [Phycisphaerae bacterium]|nr:tyrosine-protein phosphatase [Phycisphaerae bacterium]